jgi:hypothetical protein
MRYLLAFLLLFAANDAWGQCSQANSDCTPKLLTNPVISTPTNAETANKILGTVVTETNSSWNSKILTAVVVGPDVARNNKLLTGVVVEQSASSATMPPIASPLTHW